MPRCHACRDTAAFPPGRRGLIPGFHDEHSGSATRATPRLGPYLGSPVRARGRAAMAGRGAATQGLGPDPGRQPDRPLVDHPAARRRQHHRWMAHPARGRQGLASAQHRPVERRDAGQGAGRRCPHPGRRHPDAHAGVRHRRVRDVPDPAGHAPAGPPAADPGRHPAPGRRRRSSPSRAAASARRSACRPWISCSSSRTARGSSG